MTTSSKIWACASVGACTTSFILAALPYLQFAAVLIAIISGIKALRDKK